MAALAIGTQTTASTIRPASFCGVFGYRPTYGELRCMGVKESSGSLDTVGLIARSIEDIALYRDVLLGSDPQPLPEQAAPPRIGFCRTHLWPQLEPATQKLLEDAAQRLSRAGAKVEDVTLPAEFERVEDAHRWISSFEFTRNLAWEIEYHWEKISETCRNGRIKDGLSCTYERYRDACAYAVRCRRLLAPIFERHDVLLTAPATGEAPVGLNSTGNAALCAIWTTMHVPAITLPVFKGPHGLPVGAQLIGKRRADRALFTAARWVYRSLV
jgi:amidase